ncbi:hypothetical protein DMUE_4149 [Dictyocoela muelleri]|nr:hypothetical protein DMUE_4149 [Dictyocoela muelleri]
MMNEEIMNINFYMLEGIRNFECFKLREKISITLQKFEIQFQEAFFKKIRNNKDFSSWDGSKIFLSEYCLRKNIECMQKYTDEKLSEFIERLMSYAMQHDIEEAEVIEKLRSVKVGNHIKILFLTSNILLKDINKSIKVWELNYKGKIKTQLSRENKRIKCLICKPAGQFKRECKLYTSIKDEIFFVEQK